MKFKQWYIALLAVIALAGCQATNQPNTSSTVSSQSTSESIAESKSESVATNHDIPTEVNDYIEAAISLPQEIAQLANSSEAKELKADTFKQFQKVHNATVEKLHLASSYFIENNDIQQIQEQVSGVLTEIGKQFKNNGIGEIADLTKLSSEFQAKINEFSGIAKDAQNKLKELTDKKEINAKVTLKVQGKDVEGKVEKAIKVKSGTNLMTALKDNFEIEEKNGLITAIDQIVSDKGDNKGRYWKLLVNDKMAEVGANDIIVQDNDHITFDLTSEW